MKAPFKPSKIRVHVDRASARRILVVAGSLILFAITGVTLAVPVTFTDGNVLTAKQLNDNFADLDQRLSAAAGHDVAGTRLKGKYLLGADGSREYQKGVWYDSQRKEDCTYELLTDGNKHCLSQGFVEGYYFYYIDSLCTRLVLLMAPPKSGCVAPPAPIYLRMTEADTYCGLPDGPAKTLHSLVGPVTSLPAKVFDRLDSSPSGCQPSAKSVPTGWPAYEYGPEIAPSNFVQASGAVDP